MIAEREPHSGEVNRRYFREIAQTPLLTREEEQTLARKARRGDPAAIHRLVTANLRLVVKIAAHYVGNGLPLADLVAEGNTGLMKAAEHYRPGTGAKFSSYAAFWIKQRIRKALTNQSRVIRLPASMTERLSRMERVRRTMEQQLSEPVTDQILAMAMKTTAFTITHLCMLNKPPVPLDAPSGDDDDRNLSDMLADTTAHSAFEAMNRREVLESVMRAIADLPPREREIIKCRFGLNGRERMTLKQTGRRFRLTRERIRQIQNTVVAKLQRVLTKQDVCKKHCAS